MEKRHARLPALAILMVLVVVSTALAEGPTVTNRLTGGWTINRDRSSTPLAVERAEGKADEPGKTPRNGGDREGNDGPGGGKAGENKSGGGWDGFSGGPAPEDLRLALSLARELATQPPHLSIAIDGQAVRIEEANGTAVRYATNNKKERHQLTAGAVDVQTKWDKGDLHQEFKLLAGIKVKRVLAVTPDGNGLVVTAALSGLADGTRLSPSRTVYDRDGAR